MPQSLLLVGAGQLGSRYLQGFVASESELEITVVDPSLESLQTAKSRWIEAGGDRCSHEVRWLGSLPADLKRVDIALIVTSSKGRASLIKKIANTIQVSYWVLEKHLAQSASELNLIQLATANSLGCWVNLPRRLMKWHSLLKAQFAEIGPLHVSVSTGLPELAGNCIHFIDLVSWWTGEQLRSVDTTFLGKDWFPAKRPRYYEIDGELTVRFSGGSTLIVREGPKWPVMSMRISTLNAEYWEVDENLGTAIAPSKECFRGVLELQSSISGRLVDEILLRGKCDLPTLHESAATYTIFLDAMLAHWNRAQNRNDDLVPIT